ncbi:DUF2690 domain-containing protein [Kitasatospora sp. NRRL B-11411]|uniref:DUF2690 domain-containing protein n=1 Tax=Kitasatospora sp. NRRL B-11411 TaxID=1463822 RepID=UPI0012FF5526|nr:DUF2690 domain-containing protein [Kitasatospora sp. NRRL B-11411]
MRYPMARRRVLGPRPVARWRAVAAALFALVAPAGLVASAVPAAAEEGYCWQSDCDGKSPVNTNCANDIIVIEEKTFSTSINMKLVYSWLCESYWAHVQVDPTSITVPIYGGVFYVPQLGGVEQVKNSFVTWENVGAATPMVSSLNSVKACYTDMGSNFDPLPDTGGASTHAGQCTQWH